MNIFRIFIISLTFTKLSAFPVSTDNPEAQKKFDQGLIYIFAYNHDFAYTNFKQASDLDPHLAMAYWGMALALGQNINQDVTPENEKRAFVCSRKAMELAPHATKPEQDYIQALSVRYTDDPKADLVPLRFLYRDAMKKLMDTYPQDLDAASIYAESILNLDPWKYWTWDGKPKEGTVEAIEVLKSVMIRNPDHLGANHYYIHAWEESPWPQNALMSAFRLTELYKESGHLLHMPCHIFILCGYYDEAIKTSKNAIAADHQYIQEHGMEGDYPLHYLTHNLKILARVYMLSGDYENAILIAKQLLQFVGPHMNAMPHLSNSSIIPMEINLYFQKWCEVLELPAPPQGNATAQSYWHYARAEAFIHLGNEDAYQRERALMLEFKQKIPPKEEMANNPSVNIIGLAEILLDASRAESQNKPDLAIEHLTKAVDIEDRFFYDEPPAWYMPIRMTLGEALLKQKRFKEAEPVFQKALSELQRNGRLLNGLYESLKGQGKDWDAEWVKREAQAIPLPENKFTN